MAKKKINKKEQKRAFTLIELLAVIVILAIIALIATPIVMSLLNKSRQKSAENSAYSYLKATEYYIGLSELEIEPKRLEAGKCYNVTDSTIINDKATEKLNDLVDIKGSKPTGLEDHLCFDENYTVKEGILTINGYTIEIKDEKVVNSVKGAKINVKDFTLNVSSEISMERNTTLTIKANSFDPANASNQKLLFESKNEDIITVTNDGLVTALKNGEGTIVVTSEDNNNIKKEIKITVVSPQDITEIEISKVNETEELYVGKYLNLKAIIKPSDAVMNSLTWASEDTSVATVDETGKVFGKSIGKAIITATSESGVVAEFEVEVKAILANSISISGSNEIAKGQTMTLTAVISPSDTTNKTVTWSSSNTSVLTVDSTGKVTAKNYGSATITATTSNGKQATKKVEVTAYENGTVVYYNPTAGSKCSASQAVSTTGTKSGCMKFYIFNDTKTSSTVNLILDHNTTAVVEWNTDAESTIIKDAKETLQNDTSNWKQTARLITADEVAEITGAKTTLQWTSSKTYADTPTIGTDISDFYLDGAKGTDSTWQTRIATSQGASDYAWLFDNTYNCTKYGCNKEDSITWGYWTSTPAMIGKYNRPWAVAYKAMLLSNDYSNYGRSFGIRPVITVSKSDI